MSGGVRIRQHDPLIVASGDSVAVVYGVEPTGAASKAPQELATVMRATVREAVVVLADEATARVYVMRRSELTP